MIGAGHAAAADEIKRQRAQVGYAHGRQVFKKNLGTAFWTDTKQYINEEFGDPDNGWGRREWIDFYIAAAAAFRRGHVTEE